MLNAFKHKSQKSEIQKIDTFFFLRSLSLEVDTASRTNLIYVGRTSLGTELTTLDKACHATCQISGKITKPNKVTF